jgi:DNA-binding response OmpR family regulator
MRILLVDDNRDAADTLGTLLRLRGHKVQVAYDGFTALAVARRFEPEAALLDIEMPRMHGGKVALALRRQAGSEGLRIIAMSASDTDDDRVAAYNDVFDDYISKGSDLGRLEELLADCCVGAM